MNNIAIIILHFGDIKNTVQCLKSLEKIRFKPKPIIYVIDNGTNNLKRFIPSVKIKQICLKKNLGFAGGMNTGIKKALKGNFEYILLLNNDTIVKPKILTELIKPFKDNNVGICSSIITYYDNPNRIWFAGGSLNKTFCFTRHLAMEKKLNACNVKSRVDFITGAAMMIKKEVFENIGLFDEDYFLYWEDVDFCFRAKQKGYDCKIIYKPLVAHKVSSSTGISGKNKLTPLRAYYYARNPFLFIKKNELKISTSILGQVIIRLPYYIISIQNKSSLLSYIKGIKDGIKRITN